MDSAHEFFVHELSDILDAERKILGILEEQAGEANREVFRKACEFHHSQTESQIERLEQCFEELEEEAQETECKGIVGLKQEKEDFLGESPSEELLEMFDVAATTKVEHYEIAAYNSLIDLGTKLGLKKVVRLLNQNLREEEQMLKKAENIAKKIKPTIENVEEEEIEVAEEEEPTTTRSRSRRRAA